MVAIALIVGLVVGFVAGYLTRRHRVSLLAENNHWCGEEIEALKGADLHADVARERALRLSGEHKPVELYDQDADPAQVNQVEQDPRIGDSVSRATLPALLCDNRCGTPARWVWDDGAPHAACDGCVDLWWPDGIDLLVVTDLEATDPFAAVALDPHQQVAEVPAETWNAWTRAIHPELADPDTPDTAPRTVPGTRLD